MTAACSVWRCMLDKDKLLHAVPPLAVQLKGPHLPLSLLLASIFQPSSSMNVSSLLL